MIDQVTVFLPNEPGALAGVAALLGGMGIQMHTLMVADTADYGIVRIICDTPNAAARALAEHGYRAAATQVSALEVDNVPGGLAQMLTKLADAQLNVEYAYCASIGDRTFDIVKLTGEPVALRLKQAGLRELAPAELYVPDAE
ncbi:MAG: hypothetical protein IKF14_08575 [Atopobiaceae bacterium]|nr:hypothetical protein [Atopobiaceae bacterium]